MNKILTRSLLISSLFSMCLLVGCAGSSNPRDALPEKMPATVEHWCNGAIDHAEFQKKFRLEDYSGVVFTPIDTSAVTASKGDAAYEALMDVFNNGGSMMAGGALTKLYGIIPCKAVKTSQPPTGKVLVVTSKLTAIESGSHAVRILFPWGVGGVYAEIEGDIHDATTHEVFVKYSTRKHYSTTDPTQTDSILFGKAFSETGEDLSVLILAFKEK